MKLQLLNVVFFLFLLIENISSKICFWNSVFGASNGSEEQITGSLGRAWLQGNSEAKEENSSDRNLALIGNKEKERSVNESLAIYPPSPNSSIIIGLLCLSALILTLALLVELKSIKSSITKLILKNSKEKDPRSVSEEPKSTDSVCDSIKPRSASEEPKSRDSVCDCIKDLKSIKAYLNKLTLMNSEERHNELLLCDRITSSMVLDYLREIADNEVCREMVDSDKVLSEDFLRQMAHYIVSDEQIRDNLQFMTPETLKKLGLYSYRLNKIREEGDMKMKVFLHVEVEDTNAI